MKTGIFVDGENIKRSLTKGKNIDYSKLLVWLAKKRKVTEAHYFNAQDREANYDPWPFFGHVNKSGFTIHIGEITKINGIRKQYGIDSHLSIKAARLMENYDRLILVSGDYDFLPLLKEAVSAGKSVEVVSFKDCLHPIYKELYPVRYLDEFVELQEPNKEGNK